MLYAETDRFEESEEHYLRCLSVWELYRRRWPRALERLADALAADAVEPG